MGTSHIVIHDGAYDVKVRTGMDFLVVILHNANVTCPHQTVAVDLGRQRP